MTDLDLQWLWKPKRAAAWEVWKPSDNAWADSSTQHLKIPAFIKAFAAAGPYTTRTPY